MFDHYLNATPLDILHVFLKYGTKTFFDAEYFSKSFLNEFLSLELSLTKVYKESLCFLKEKATSLAKGANFVFDVNETRALLTVAYVYTKATNSPLDLESLLNYCQSKGLSRYYHWYFLNTDEGIKKFVFEIQQVLQQSTSQRESLSDNAHD